MRFLLIGMLCIYSIGLQAQTIQKQIDSLLQEAETANDSTRLAILNRVGFHYVFNDLPKAKTYLLKGLSEAYEKDNTYWKAAINNSYGIYMDVSGQSDSARFYFEKGLAIAKEAKIPSITSNATGNLGMYHWNRSEHKQALAYFFDALAMDKKLGEAKGMAPTLSNIGLIYQDMGLFDKALEYHNEALAIRRDQNLMHQIPISLNNIAETNRQQGNYDAALTKINESLAIAERQQMKREYLTALTIKGNLLMLKNELDKALPIFEEAIAQRERTNIDKRNNLENIVSVIEIHNKKGNTQKATEYILKAEALLEEFPEVSENVASFHAQVAETYFRSGRPEAGMANLKKSFTIRDSIFSEQNAAEMAALETKYKVAENEAALATTRANLAETELKVKRRNTLIFGSLGLAMLLGLLGLLFYNQQKLKNRQLQKEAELTTALAKIETQNRLQEQRLRISRDLHDNIGAQLTFIISSIDNLKYALDNTDKMAKKKLTLISTFTTQTIYELRDTIWAMNKESISFDDLQGRISNFISKVKETTETTALIVSIDPKVNQEIKFSSVQGMNIYRIIQEAVHNAVKHAAASEITVAIERSNGNDVGPFSLTITIKDNGLGFDPTAVNKGNGFSSITTRAQELGGSARVYSERGEGTKWVLMI